MSAVTIKNVSKSFGDNTVLHDFSQVFADGEFVTLLGPSGCGKTTMLRMIAGFEKPTTGEIYVGETLVSGDKTFLPPEKRNMGMVFQSYAVWPHMNVYDNVAYPLTIKRMNKTDMKKKVEKVLSIVHLGQYAQRYPNQLSGGQQQRVVAVLLRVGPVGMGPIQLVMFHGSASSRALGGQHKSLVRTEHIGLGRVQVQANLCA